MADIQFDFSGVWRSSYYKLESREVITEQYVTLRVIGNQLILESIPGPTEAPYLLGRFTIDGSILTGSYQSQNSPKNSTKGALYYGAAQLKIDEDGRALRGMGVGFGKNMEIKPTIWEVVHVGRSQTRAGRKAERTAFT